MSFSGRCILSNETTLRDANRGGCAQVCRWIFDTSYDKPFTMMPKDLNMIENIKDMIDSKIVSYKVEGRMRSVYYVATIISTYRKIFDLIKENKLLDSDKKYALAILNRCANRESTDHFWIKNPGVSEQYFGDREEITNKDFLGIVKNYDNETKIVTLEQRNYFKLGDVVEFIGPKMETFTYTINKIYNKDNEEIIVANHPQMIVKLKVDCYLPTNAMMRSKVIDKNDYL